MDYKLRNSIIALLMILTLGVTSEAFARDRDDHGHGHDRDSKYHHHYDYRHHPTWGFRFSFIPDYSHSFYMRGARYYYYDGLYYRNYGREYVLVEPPIGAVVRRIPVDFRPVIVNGVTYYTDNGVYYVYTPGGYQVVPAPVTVLQTSPVVVQAPTPVPVQIQPAATTQVTLGNDDTFTVNVPNDKTGGYTAVTLKRDEKGGFIGPQGEYYPKFPSVAQLKAMYVK